jgi:hypothetical protein
MEHRPEVLYLDLLKKALSYSLWPEPLVPVDRFNYLRRPLKRGLLSVASRCFRPLNLQLVIPRSYMDEHRYEGRIWPGYAHTMIGLKRLDNLQSCIETASRDHIPVDLIETGVWRGGACIFMRAVLAAHGVGNRKVLVADSFEGLPKPDVERYPEDAGDGHYLHAPFLGVSREEVENNFRHYGLLDDQVVFLEGWFKDTLPNAPIKQLAVLRLDGDMYGSTMDALFSLYPKLSPGGFCIIDDYAMPNCKRAVEDYREQNQIKAEIQAIDWTGHYWRKDEAG